MRSLTIQESGVTSTLDIYEFGSGSPRVVFTAGIHGGEVTGVYVAEQLIEYFTHNPPLKGSVKILPRCNPTATRCLQRRSPFDSEDLNRIFPGSAQGSLSHRIADAVWHETADADYLIDLHCCGQHGLPYLLGIYDESQPARALAEQIAMPVAVQSGGTAGQLFTDSCRHRGQAAIIIERAFGPSSGAVNPVVAEQAVTGLLFFLTRIGIVEGRENTLRPYFLRSPARYLCPRVRAVGTAGPARRNFESRPDRRDAERKAGLRRRGWLCHVGFANQLCVH